MTDPNARHQAKDFFNMASMSMVAAAVALPKAFTVHA